MNSAFFCSSCSAFFVALHVSLCPSLSVLLSFSNIRVGGRASTAYFCGRALFALAPVLLVYDKIQLWR